MAKQPHNGVFQHICKMAAVQTYRELSDRDLLERLVGAGDEAAFTILIERHGPMVLGVCRRVLPNYHDAEDACQATFLVLARTAASVRKKTSLSSWLHGVACRVAVKLKRGQARRTAREQGFASPQPRDPAAEVSWREVQAILDEELQRLPERYRAPVILCYLECLTRDEAAKQLGLVPTTLYGRLERARNMLRRCLSKRGLTLSAALSATAVSEAAAHAALAPTLVVSSTRAATLLAAGQTFTDGVVASNVVGLAKEVLKNMFLTKLKTVVLSAMWAGLLLAAIGGSFTTLGTAGGPEGAPRAAQETKKDPPSTTKQPSPGASAAKDVSNDELARAAIYVLILPNNADAKQHPCPFRFLAEAIKTSPQQDKALAKIYEDRIRNFHANKDISIEARIKAVAGVQEAVSRVLKPDQVKRLEQIGLQTRGLLPFRPCAGALSFPDVQKNLKFSDKQKEQIKSIEDDARSAWEQAKRQLIMETGNDSVGSGPYCIRVNKETQGRAIELLTREQKKEWKEMIGDAWDLEQLYQMTEK